MKNVSSGPLGRVQFPQLQVALDMDEGSNVQSYWFMVRSDEDLKITLTWSDVPGQVSSERHLINDLDLEIVDPDGKMYSGNNFTDGETDALDEFAPDRVNNVEGILVKEPTEGLWNLRVRAYNIPQGDQGCRGLFALGVAAVLCRVEKSDHHQGGPPVDTRSILGDQEE